MMRPHLQDLAAEAAYRLGLSSNCRWCVVCYCALGRRPNLLPERKGDAGRELAARDLLDPDTRKFSVARLLAAAGLTWKRPGGPTR